MSYHFPIYHGYTDNLKGENDNVLVNYHSAGAYPLQPLTKHLHNSFSTYSNNNGIRLFDVINGQKLISPFGIFYIMLLATNGANDDTLKQLLRIFNIGDVNTINNELINLRTIMDDVKMASGIFVQNNYEISNKYSNFVSNFTELRNIDFKNTQSIKEINDWIAKQTLIKDVIPFNPKNKLMLVNAIYFKADWNRKFTDIKESSFYINNKTIKTLLMNKIDSVRYNEDNANQIIELDYKNVNYCMGILLPKNKYIMPSTTMSTINDHIGRMNDKIVNIYLPKFIQNNKLELINAFKQIGITNLFGENADLSKLSNDDLCVSSIIHEAIVVVDENGADGGASIALKIHLASDKERTVFRADHPFIYYIRYKPSNLILFVGQYNGMI